MSADVYDEAQRGEIHIEILDIAVGYGCSNTLSTCPELVLRRFAGEEDQLDTSTQSWTATRADTLQRQRTCESYARRAYSVLWWMFDIS